MKLWGDTLISIITTILYTVLSAGTIIAMRYETNRRLRSRKPVEDNENIKAASYQLNGIFCLSSFFLIGISAFCGYIVSKNAVSIIANFELGMCYLATLAAAVIDLKTRTIPNFIPIILVCARLVFFIYEILFVDAALSYLVSSLMGCFLCALLLIIANKISKGGIGGGDIKLLSCIGLMCGVYVVFSTLLLALIACMVVSFVFLALKKHSLKEHLPFGPFIYLGLTAMCLFTLY